MSLADAPNLCISALEYSAFFRSSDVEETHLYAANLISDHRLKVSGPSFEAKINHYTGSDVSFIRMRFGATVRIEPDAIDAYFLLHVPLEGHSWLHHPEGEFRLSPLSAGIISANVPFDITWAPNCSKLIVLIARDKVAKVCRNLIGKGYRAPLLLHPEVKLNDGAGVALLNLLDYGLRLSSLPVSQKSLAQESYDEMLVAHLLSCQGHNYTDFIESKAGSLIVPHCVRVAERYIEENLSAPLTLSDIAEHCEVTIRTLTRSFRSFRNKTPMTFLTERRLDQVRLALQQSTGQSIAEIAYGWGFTHLGRFAQRYHERFGELPSHTAKQSA